MTDTMTLYEWLQRAQQINTYSNIQAPASIHVSLYLNLCIYLTAIQFTNDNNNISRKLEKKKQY